MTRRRPRSIRSSNASANSILVWNVQPVGSDRSGMNNRAASGKQNAAGDTEDVKGTLVDAGIGLQYGFGKNISGNLQFAFPVREDFNQDSITVPDDRMKVVFDFQYQF